MQKQATIYRMVMEKHTCPYGLKSLDLLKRQGFDVEDHHLTSREETDAFKKNIMCPPLRNRSLTASASGATTN